MSPLSPREDRAVRAAAIGASRETQELLSIISRLAALCELREPTVAAMAQIENLTEERGLVVAFELATTTVPGCEGARFLCTIHDDGKTDWVGGGDDLPAALAAAVAKLPERG